MHFGRDKNFEMLISFFGNCYGSNLTSLLVARRYYKFQAIRPLILQHITGGDRVHGLSISSSTSMKKLSPSHCRIANKSGLCRLDDDWEKTSLENTRPRINDGDEDVSGLTPSLGASSFDQHFSTKGQGSQEKLKKLIMLHWSLSTVCIPGRIQSWRHSKTKRKDAMDALGLGASIVWLDGWQKKNHTCNLTNDILYPLSVFSVLELTKMGEWLCCEVFIKPGSVFENWWPTLESILYRQTQVWVGRG